VVVDPRADQRASDEQAVAGAAYSRRLLLSGGAGAATAAFLAACSGAKPLREKVRGGGKVSRADVAPLNTLLDVEHYAIAAYAAGIPLLHSPQAESGIQFLAQELAHAVALSDLIRKAKGKPHRPQASYDLGHPQTPAEVMALLKRIEQTQLRTYLATLARLQGPGSRSAAVSIMANDAQHLAMLRWQTGESPTPAALVTGS
jgi:Ferritin-like domain